MAWSDYYDAPTGLTLYAKPKPLVVSPWATDVVTMTESGTTGEYAITGLTDGIDYTVFIQGGVSPADSDTKDGSIYFRIPLATITALQADVTSMAAEVNKVPRAATALTAGDDVTRTKQSATSTVLVERLS